jgi:tRNA-Thr(GGU) m(6)t(6)A37 methyltransferase TsaA
MPEVSGEARRGGRRDLIVMKPIGLVVSSRTEPVDDNWDAVTSRIELDARACGPESVQGLDEFSHVEVVYVFDRVIESAAKASARHPRGNTDWPSVGIFAQRAKDRPNRIGVSMCELLGVEALTLTVKALDAINGSPVLDIKPYMPEFAPRGEIRQPRWSRELMAGYWTPSP